MPGDVRVPPERAGLPVRDVSRAHSRAAEADDEAVVGEEAGDDVAAAVAVEVGDGERGDLRTRAAPAARRASRGSIARGYQGGARCANVAGGLWYGWVAMTAAAKLVTYEDLLALPEEVRAEVLGGEVVTQASPSPAHYYAQFRLVRALDEPYQLGHGGPGGWWFLSDVDVRLAAHEVVRPDAAGWRRERLPSPWNMRPIDVVPDWIAEVLSPFGIERDRVIKMELYARCGVPFYWIVDPVARVLEVYALERGRWMVAGTFDRTAVVRIPPFEAIEVVVGELFHPDEAQAE